MQFTERTELRLAPDTKKQLEYLATKQNTSNSMVMRHLIAEAFKKQVRKSCEVCEKSFNAERRTRRYCSDACKAKAYRDSKKQVRKR